MTQDMGEPEALQEFVEYLTRQPPYEAIGKVIHAGSDVDMGVHAMCETYGRPWPASFGQSVQQRVGYLFASSDLAKDVLQRVQPAMKRRNLLAHGTWLNLHHRGEGFVTHVAETTDLRGELISDEVLEAWYRDLQDIADYFTSRYLEARA